MTLNVTQYCNCNNGKKGRTNPVTGRGGPYSSETSRLPRFIDYRLTDDGEVVSLTSRPPALYSQEISWYSFMLETELNPEP
jgi:hypothetical protein